MDNHSSRLGRPSLNTDSDDEDDEIFGSAPNYLASMACSASSSSLDFADTDAQPDAHPVEPQPAKPQPVDLGLRDTLSINDDILISQFHLVASTKSWTWTPSDHTLPRICIHPSEVENPHILAWTPIQVGICARTTEHRLTVPSGFILDNPNPNSRCWSCSTSGSRLFRQLCVNRTGWSADELTAADIDIQRSLGVHATRWTLHVGVCRCEKMEKEDRIKERKEKEKKETISRMLTEIAASDPLSAITEEDEDNLLDDDADGLSDRA